MDDKTEKVLFVVQLTLFQLSMRSSACVPIPFRHTDASEDIFNSDDLLDNRSQETFTFLDHLASLSVYSIDTEITGKTLISVETEECQLVSGLHVKGIHSDCNKWLTLQSQFTTYKKEEIPTPEKL